MSACTMCGACCVAPDIAALDKPLGLRCPHLAPDSRCLVYENRPSVCRSYQADEVCEKIAAPTIEQRVAKYLALFGVEEEAKRVLDSGSTSMRSARLSADIERAKLISKQLADRRDPLRREQSSLLRCDRTGVVGRRTRPRVVRPS